MGNSTSGDKAVEVEPTQTSSFIPGDHIPDNVGSPREEDPSLKSNSEILASSYDCPWFADQTVHDAPDYTSDDAWAALPDSSLVKHRPALSIFVQGESKFKEKAVEVFADHWGESGEPGIDCFYVHPTTYIVGRASNQSIAKSRKDKQVSWCIQTQASLFDGPCRVFSPHYRQASLHQYARPMSKGQGAFELAYSDIRCAFFSYLERFNCLEGKKRPFILAGHSQGSQHLIRLLKEEFDVDSQRGAELRGQLVCAYTLGFGVGHDTFPGGLMRPADGPEDVGACFVSFCTVNTKKKEVGLHNLGDYMLTKSPISHNPLSWRYNDGELCGIEAHLGSIDQKGSATYATSRGGLVSAVVSHEGVLRIDDTVYRAYCRNLEDFGGEYHSMEINLFWLNLRSNIRRRVECYLRSKAS